MSNPAVTQGTFADFKLVKTRSVCQVVIEIPIAEADKALDALGGLPRPESERWIALARLNVTSIKPQKERQAWDSLKLAQQAGIRCGEPAFQRYLSEHHIDNCPDERTAVAYVHGYCGIDSRSGLNDNPKAAAKWVELDTQFQLWMREPQHA
jgi:hypothetical protein